MIQVDKIILYCDDHLLVVNKPAGLSTLVDGWRPEADHLLGVLKDTYKPLWVVHRLDRETSGVIVFARTAEAHRSLNRQFETRKIEKIYHAFVQGNPTWENKEIRRPLRANGDRRHRTVEDPVNGKPAITTVKVIERLQGWTLIEASPKTGRTHQIRAHLALAGLPIAGDHLYGSAKDNRFRRLMLHAYSLRFKNPLNGGEMVFEACYPNEFKAAIQNITRQSV